MRLLRADRIATDLHTPRQASHPLSTTQWADYSVGRLPRGRGNLPGVHERKVAYRARLRDIHPLGLLGHGQEPLVFRGFG